MYDVTILSCIYHDIGIPEARRKHGTSAPRYQELEGPAVAKELMDKIDMREDIIERVCFIVGNHHSKEKIDGLDFQILWEADMITNIEEGWKGINKSYLKEHLDENFKTSLGKNIILKLL